jgi:hypothetical protein
MFDNEMAGTVGWGGAHEFLPSAATLDRWPPQEAGFDENSSTPPPNGIIHARD